MAKGRSVYVKAKKEFVGDRAHWSEKKKMEAVTTYIATGTLPLTSAATGVPSSTLRVWKRAQWWKEAIGELQYEDNIEISAKLSKLLEKSLAAVEDRLDNGEHMYDPRTGKIKRIPPKLRDVYKVTNDIVEKKQQLLKMHVKEELNNNTPQQVTADHLVQLAQAFAAMATGSPINPKGQVTEIIEGEASEILEELGYEALPVYNERGIHKAQYAAHLKPKKETDAIHDQRPERL